MCTNCGFTDTDELDIETRPALNMFLLERYLVEQLLVFIIGFNSITLNRIRDWTIVVLCGTIMSR